MADELFQELFVEIVVKQLNIWNNTIQNARGLQADFKKAQELFDSIKDTNYLTKKEDIRDILKTTQRYRSERNLSPIELGEALYLECLCCLALGNFRLCYNCLDQIDSLKLKRFSRERKREALNQLKTIATNCRVDIKKTEEAREEKIKAQIEEDRQAKERELESYNRMMVIEQYCEEGLGILHKIQETCPKEDSSINTHLQTLITSVRRQRTILVWSLILISITIVSTIALIMITLN